MAVLHRSFDLKYFISDPPEFIYDQLVKMTTEYVYRENLLS